MKSQDIFLLLKLVSLQQSEQKIASLRLEHQQKQKIAEDNLMITEWQDWHDTDEFKIPPQNDEDTLNDEDALVAQYTVRTLAVETGISKSQISLALQRCYAVTLAKPDRHTGVPRTNVKALEEFIIYGIRYVFPAKPQAIGRGIATGWAAPVLKGELMTAGELLPVWADALGKTMGQVVEPLFKTIPQAIRRDQCLYALLALTDAIRLGQPRERAVAADKLSKRLRGIEYESKETVAIS